MDHVLFNSNSGEFRYGSGTTVYSEVFRQGRLICLDYHAAGMPQNPKDRLKNANVPAFQLEIDGKDASFGWQLINWEKGRLDDGRSFGEITLQHEKLPVELRIRTMVGEKGYFSRHLQLKNMGDAPVSITRVSPLSGSLWEMTDEIAAQIQDGDLNVFSVGSFQGRYWGTEGQFNWYNVDFNSMVEIGSTSGRSGHGHPFAIVHNHLLGGYFVCQLEWSANWSFRFSNDFRYFASAGSNAFLRLVFELGPKGTAPMRVVDPGESIEIPEIHFGFVYSDFDGAIQELHDYQRKYILARPPQGREYVSYDPWGYEGWDANEERYLSELERARALGAELFVIDAGWYGLPGSPWDSTVGDWDIPRMPNDLYPIVKKAHEYGMKIGLWVEPEAVGRDSELRRKHPDWLMKRYGENIERSLDLTNPEVEQYIEKQLVDVVARYKLDLLRLDYNNQFLNEGGFVERNGYMENTHWRHVEAIYRIFDHLRDRFPNLQLENCAGGGGRTDLGMMKRFSKTQFSDWYRFPRIARTFNGMTMCLPPEHLMGHYGAAMSQERYGCTETHLQMLFLTVPRICGIAPWDESVNPELINKFKKYIRIYKDFIRPIQEVSKVYHHTPVVPGIVGRGWTVLEFSMPDASKGYAIVIRLPATEDDTWVFMARGVNRARTYKIILASDESEFYVSGFELATRGLPVRLDGGALTSELILMEAVEQHDCDHHASPY